MACKGYLGCLLKLMNFLLALVGLAMVGYGLYLFVGYKQASSGNDPNMHSSGELIKLHRPMLMAVSLDSVFDKLPKAWFIYLFIGIGVVLVIISCCGCISATLRNGCCLTCYSIFVILLILIELGCAAFIFFDKSWKEAIPTDKTGNFGMLYNFMEKHWKIIRWVALGAVILEALVFVLALVVRAVNRPANYDYDSDDESIGSRRQTRQPLLNRTAAVPTTGDTVAGTIDQRPSRNDAWSARMRDKVLVFVLALVVRAVNRPANYDHDSDDESIGSRQQTRQPLLNKTAAVPTTGDPVAGTIDQRPSRNDAWSARMRDKYGLDTSEFTYNPSEPNRNQQAATQPSEERSRCIIM
ncbi:unnamed protein product [Fraxinus pennsylvanica]|uniref:Tobamovirus multiplication protein 2A n=1 Tax=Fraxinus pennsylvanica TaxID=56036 RepID=A0AAD1ZMD4_9LAMI|nr:unnamed protein product [Fraxinus pennsylvanica]